MRSWEEGRGRSSVAIFFVAIADMAGLARELAVHSLLIARVGVVRGILVGLRALVQRIHRRVSIDLMQYAILRVIFDLHGHVFLGISSSDKSDVGS